MVRLLLLSSCIFAIFAVVTPPIHAPSDDGNEWTAKHEAEMRRRCPPITTKELKVGSIHRDTDSDDDCNRNNQR